MDDGSILPQVPQALTDEQKLHDLIVNAPIPDYMQRLLEQDALTVLHETGQVPTAADLRTMLKQVKLAGKRGRATRPVRNANAKAKAKRKQAKQSRRKNRGK